MAAGRGGTRCNRNGGYGRNNFNSDDHFFGESGAYGLGGLYGAASFSFNRGDHYHREDGSFGPADELFLCAGNYINIFVFFIKPLSL